MMSANMLWFVWGLIGLIGGYMGGRLLLSEGKVLVSVLVGVAGSLLGGWLFVVSMGMSEQNGYLSMITSMIMCALVLWIYCSLADNKPRQE